MDTSAIPRGLDPCASSKVPLDTDADPPGFKEPWHAQAFATAMALSRAGVIDWDAWVATFSAEVRTNPQRDKETSESAYYRQWLAALETIVERVGVMTPMEIDETAEHWRRSYLNTPHGKPIELSRDWPAPRSRREHHDHGHDHHLHHEQAHHHDAIPQPVAIDPARPAGRSQTTPRVSGRAAGT